MGAKASWKMKFAKFCNTRRVWPRGPKGARLAQRCQRENEGILNQLRVSSSQIKRAKLLGERAKTEQARTRVDNAERSGAKQNARSESSDRAETDKAEKTLGVPFTTGHTVGDDLKALSAWENRWAHCKVT